MYIGETKRKIITRIKEHQNACKRAVQNGMVHSKGENDMGLPLHHLREGHSFDFERFEIISHDKSAFEFVTKRATGGQNKGNESYADRKIG